MIKRYLFLALLIAGLAISIPASATVAPNPDTADGIDAHSNTVVEGLVNAVSDITSGNTVQVGPIGGIYIGGGSSTMGFESSTAYSGACVLSSLILTGQKSSQAGGDATAAVVTGEAVLESVSFVNDTDDGYVEFYDGAARGDLTTCKLDLSAEIAGGGKVWTGSMQFNEGIYVYMSGGGSYQLGYRLNDFIEIYDGTARGTYSTCLLDIRVPVGEGTKIYATAPIECTTGIYVHNSDANNMWGVQYRVEDQSE